METSDVLFNGGYAMVQRAQHVVIRTEQQSPKRRVNGWQLTEGTSGRMAADREEPLMSHSTLGDRRLGDTQHVEKPTMMTSAKRTAMTASVTFFTKMF